MPHRNRVSPPPHMAEFIDYVVTLEQMALTGHPSPELEFAPALDGEAGRELTRLVSLRIRRSYGAFFTGSDFAVRLIQHVPSAKTYFDPSVGAGDLLLSAARRLPVRRSLRATLNCWSRLLGGHDLHGEFVRATKARLVLMARNLGVFTEALPPACLRKIFPGITVADALKTSEAELPYGAILMNPPYSARRARRLCPWASGKINAAALFVERYLKRAKPGATLVAILPEVLRSGSFYDRWRTHIAAHASSLATESLGLFGANADVDVFLLCLTKKANGEKSVRWRKAMAVGLSLGDKFDVSVGAVVPHRDRKVGTLRRFLDAKTAPSRGIVRRVKQRRKFLGRVDHPPFVTVKRTSRPGDKQRAIPTLVIGTKPVAVENHLIVCKPKDGTIESCVKLHRQLQSPAVTRWLNSTMRCRHLTVEAVRSISLP